jgi:hypothetical protein
MTKRLGRMARRRLVDGWTVEVIKHFFQFLPFEKET